MGGSLAGGGEHLKKSSKFYPIEEFQTPLEKIQCGPTLICRIMPIELGKKRKYGAREQKVQKMLVSTSLNISVVSRTPQSQCN